ncbi:hypothetical protein GGF32_009338 [Allomyces javanicus]|nr:hypothetical protein GGF32_009338 [Allomyces javanicus]
MPILIPIPGSAGNSLTDPKPWLGATPGTQHAVIAFSLSLIPALLASRDLVPTDGGRPIVDPNALRQALVLTFRLATPPNPTDPAFADQVTAPAPQGLISTASRALDTLAHVGITSGPATLVLNALYHPGARHLVQHGISIAVASLSLDRGLFGTVLTWVAGSAAYSIGCMATAAWHDAHFDPTTTLMATANSTKDLLGSLWDRVVAGNPAWPGAPTPEESAAVVGATLGASVTGLRARYFGHAVYGLQGVAMTVRSASLARGVRDWLRVWRVYRRATSTRAREAIEARLWTMGLNVAIGAFFLAPDVKYLVFGGPASAAAVPVAPGAETARVGLALAAAVGVGTVVLSAQ